jgi:hypothetical protein
VIARVGADPLAHRQAHAPVVAEVEDVTDPLPDEPSTPAFDDDLDRLDPLQRLAPAGYACSSSAVRHRRNMPRSTTEDRLSVTPIGRHPRNARADIAQDRARALVVARAEPEQ